MVGAGAVGGVVGGRLAEAGHEVVLVARGAHGAAMRAGGLRLESPAGVSVLRLPVADDVAGVDWRSDDVVLLAVKAHQSAGVLAELAAIAPPGLAVACVQNGVTNEREALRRFGAVYGVCVMCPTSYLEPGVVQAWSTPVVGILDVGRFPSGVDRVAEQLAAAFVASGFVSEPRPDVMAWKYQKLLMNLANALEALCGAGARAGELARRARAEGEACLEAAGIAFVSKETDVARRGDLLRLGTIGGEHRGGGSSWQSLARGAGSIETDHLNGEIVLLGRLHGVATPVNALVQRLANRAARLQVSPASMTEAEIVALLPR